MKATNSYLNPSFESATSLDTGSTTNSEITTTISDINLTAINRNDNCDNKSKTSSKNCVKYLGLIYTLLSTSSFSLATTILKKYSSSSKGYGFNTGTWAFPFAALVSVPFVIYRVQVQRKPIFKDFWPLNSIRNKKTALFIAIRTLLSSVIPYVLIWSLKYISVADTRTILAASVISVFFVGWLFLGEKCGVVPILVALLAMCGIGVMTRPPVLTGKDEFDSDTIIGVSFALLALVLVTGVICILRYLQNVYHGTLNVILYTWSTLQSIFLAWIFNELQIPGWIEAGQMIAVGLLWGFGNLFLVLALQVEQAGVVGLIRTSEVVFTFGWQWLIIGIPPDYISVLGAALVLCGVIVVILRKWVEALPPSDTRHDKLAFLLR